MWLDSPALSYKPVLRCGIGIGIPSQRFTGDERHQRPSQRLYTLTGQGFGCICRSPLVSIMPNTAQWVRNSGPWAVNRLFQQPRLNRDVPRGSPARPLRCAERRFWRCPYSSSAFSTTFENRKSVSMACLWQEIHSPSRPCFLTKAPVASYDAYHQSPFSGS